MAIKTKPFDAARFLTDEGDQADIITDALESGHVGYIAAALGTIARARGMTDIAKQTGLSRQSLYAALSDEGNPTLDTVLKVLDVLGLQLSAKQRVPEPA